MKEAISGMIHVRSFQVDMQFEIFWTESCKIGHAISYASRICIIYCGSLRIVASMDGVVA